MNFLQIIGAEPVRAIEERELSEEQLSVARVSELDLATQLETILKRLESIEASQMVVAEIFMALMKQREEQAEIWPRIDIQQKRLSPSWQETFRIDYKRSIASAPTT